MLGIARTTAASLFGLLALVPLAAGAQLASGGFTRTVDATVPVELDVRTGAGSIAVRVGDSDRVRIEGRIEVRERSGRSRDAAAALVRRFEAEPPVSVDGSRIVVGDVDDSDYRHGVTLSFEIVTPRATALVSRTGSGAQRIDGIAGPVRAEAGSGSLRVAGVDGDVSVSTGSGSIRADDIGGAFSGRAGSGSVRVALKGAAAVEVTTGSGSIDVAGVDGALTVRAGSGTVTIAGRPAGDWYVVSGSGRIRLDLPDDAAFDVDAHSGSGGIDIGHPVVVEGRVARNRLRGRVRGGGALLRIGTGSGGATID